MPKHRLEPRMRPYLPEPDSTEDVWLFAPDAVLDATTTALARDMDSLAQALEGLRETLSVINSLAPLAPEAAEPLPNAVMHHDGALFDGEPLYEQALQDTVLSDETDFIFQDIPADAKRIQQAA